MPLLEINLTDIKQTLDSTVLSERISRRFDATQKLKAIDSAYETILSSADFDFMEVEDASIAITAGSEKFTMPIDFFKFDPRVQSLYLTSKLPENIVGFIPPMNRKSYVDGVNSCEPEYWFYRGSQGFLTQPSNASYTAIMEYVKRPDKISDGEGAILIPPAKALIVAWFAGLELLTPTNPKRPEVEAMAMKLFDELVGLYSADQANNQQEYI